MVRATPAFAGERAVRAQKLAERYVPSYDAFHLRCQRQNILHVRGAECRQILKALLAVRHRPTGAYVPNAAARVEAFSDSVAPAFPQGDRSPHQRSPPGARNARHVAYSTFSNVAS